MITARMNRVLFAIGAIAAIAAAGSEAQQFCNVAIPESKPTASFIVGGDGTAVDQTTGLMWKRCAEGLSWDGAACTGTAAIYNWQAALQVGAAGTPFAGHDDWRLPNIKELQSLVEVRCFNPALNTAIFNSGYANLTWSNSPYGGYPLWAWGVRENGKVQYVQKIASFQVRLVRTASTTNVALTVVKAGAGSGTIISTPSGITCPAVCTKSYPSGSGVQLTATPTGGAVFSGWLRGGCTGLGSTCTVPLNTATTVSATFAPPGTALALDVDASAPGSKYDPLTDGLLILRYLFGLTGTSLTTSALGANATVTDPAALVARLDDIRPLFDADGNGQVEALSDGLLVLRYLFGLKGPSLIAGAIGTGATRTSAASIEAYVQGLMP